MNAINKVLIVLTLGIFVSADLMLVGILSFLNGNFIVTLCNPIIVDKWKQEGKELFNVTSYGLVSGECVTDPSGLWYWNAIDPLQLMRLNAWWANR